MIDLVPFKPEHMKLYRPGDIDRTALVGVSLTRQQKVWDGKSVSIFDGEKLLGIAGIGIEDGKYEGWLLGTDALRERPVTLHRGMKRWLDRLPELFGLKTLYCEVHSRFSDSQDWVQRLGFHAVGVRGPYVRYKIEWP